MRLCKICNIEKLPSLKHWYCVSCKKEKKRKYAIKYAKTHPKRVIKSDGKISHFWVCDCEEGWIIPKAFQKCFECGTYLYARGRPSLIQERRVFHPEIHALDINSFFDDHINI